MPAMNGIGPKEAGRPDRLIHPRQIIRLATVLFWLLRQRLTLGVRLLPWCYCKGKSCLHDEM